MTFESFSENDTINFAKDLAKNARPGDIYCLTGRLAGGKTVFAKGMARGLGVSDIVTSPTFTIMNRYEGRLPFCHFDVYRIKSIEEMYEIGYEEFFFGDGVCLVEWAGLIRPLIPPNGIWINIQQGKDENHRIIEVK